MPPKAWWVPTHLFWRQTRQCLVWNVLRKRQTASVSRQKGAWHCFSDVQRLRALVIRGPWFPLLEVTVRPWERVHLISLRGSGGAALCRLLLPFLISKGTPQCAVKSHKVGCCWQDRKGMAQRSCVQPWSDDDGSVWLP